MEDEHILAIEAENGAERGENQNLHQGEQGEKIKVLRKKIDTVTIYDVSEAELTILEKGTDATIWLNFFIGTCTTSISFLIAVLSADWGEEISLTKIVFICVTIIMGVIAVICLVFWLKGMGEHMTTIQKIRKRTIQEDC